MLFNPTVSFARMKTSGGFATPFLFNLTMVVIWAFFTMIYRLLLTGMFAAARHRRTTGQLPCWVLAGAVAVRYYWGDGSRDSDDCRFQLP